MSTYRKSKRKGRPVASYVAAAKSLSTYAPALAKYKRRKTLSPQEKGAITRKENLLRYTDKLIPLTKQQAKELKDFLYVPEKYDPKTNIKTPVYNSGIRALRLANTGEDVKVSLRGKLKIGKAGRDLAVVSNGRKWIYERIDQNTIIDPETGEIMAEAKVKRLNKKAIRDAATGAFSTPEKLGAFDKVLELAKQAFRKPKTKSIHLWTKHGRVGEGFDDYDSFIDWLDDEWMSYEDTGGWVYGIAIQV